MKKIIWANVLVKNEDRYLWFAVQSVISRVDKMIIWDTGSTDNTVEVINLLIKEYPNKISFSEKGSKTADQITKLRQEMLEQNRCDWLLLLDGDEVWWDESLGLAIDTIQSSDQSLYALVNPVYNLVGDIYHYQPESAGQYELLGRKGHFNIRFINCAVPGLHIKGKYPLEGFYDHKDRLIQDQADHLQYVDAPQMHFSHLSRSTLRSGDQAAVQRARKKKFELGNKFPSNFKFPEVFNAPYPDVVPDPWKKMSKSFHLRASLETPLRNIKRRISS